jgi:hypothetical protein
MAIYAKIENGVAVEYPLYEGDLQKIFTQYVFPLDSNIEVNGIVAPEGYAAVKSTQAKMDDVFSYYTIGMPVLVDGEWCQTWQATPMTAEQKEEHKTYLAITIREKRNQLLAESDKFVVVDRWEKYDQQVKTEWADYRQALRDITEHAEFPVNVEWPIEPSVFIINSF